MHYFQPCRRYYIGLKLMFQDQKISPYSFSCRFSSSRTTPGSTLTHISSLFISRILFIYLEISTIIPELTTCPASEVPPALSVTLDFLLCGKFHYFPDIRRCFWPGNSSRFLFINRSISGINSPGDLIIFQVTFKTFGKCIKL